MKNAWMHAFIPRLACCWEQPNDLASQSSP